MKINSEYVLRQVADMYVVIPTGKATLQFDGIINLNETGRMLWQILEKETSKEALVEALTQKFDVSSDEAEQDVEEFLGTLKQAGCLE